MTKEEILKRMDEKTLDLFINLAQEKILHKEKELEE